VALAEEYWLLPLCLLDIGMPVEEAFDLPVVGILVGEELLDVVPEKEEKNLNKNQNIFIFKREIFKKFIDIWANFVPMPNFELFKLFKLNYL
jgi:hypothetical protein